MIMDELSEFADNTTVPTSTGTALVGDVIDTGDGFLDDVDNIYFVVQVSEAFTSAGSATVEFALVSDAQAAIATDGSATVHVTVAATAVADLEAGTTLVVAALPKGTYERYLGVLATVGTAALTAGKVNAFLTPRAPTWRAFPEGNN